MSINKLVNIREAVFDATEDMGIDVSSQIPLMTNWALKAEKKIGSYYGWKKKRAVLDVKGCTAALPIGAMAVQFVVHGDHGCDCEELVGNVSRWASSFDASSNEVFLVIDYPELGSTTSCYGNDWETQDNKLVFKDNMDGDKVTIQYLGYECDEDGFIRINENHVDAISAYIKMKFAERSRFSPLKMDHTDVRELERKWRQERNMAVAADSELSETERQDTLDILHDPYVGYGLNVGME